MFSAPPKKNTVNTKHKPEKKSSDEDVSFDIKDDEEETKPKVAPKVEKPEISLEDLEAMFGSSGSSDSVSNSGSENSSHDLVSPMATSNRDRINGALDQAEVKNSVPKLKLNIDKTSVDPSIANNPAKPKIKLNIKPKQ